jgi:hypothetical protein
MTAKIAAASTEEHAFAGEVNKRLVTTGARVVPFSMVDPDKPTTYHLTVSCGAKRTAFTADSPFHYDAIDDVVTKVQQWLAGAAAADRWTTDLEKADAE